MWKGLLPEEPVVFPPDFVWGVASSAYQSEGQGGPNDFDPLIEAGFLPPNPGNGFATRFAEDFALVRGLGFGHYRLSLEWSRVEPERGRFDEAALDGYRRQCAAALACGLTPWVNFFHFTHPRWTSGLGFLADENRSAFLRYAERAVRALAPVVQHYHSYNESLIYLRVGHRDGAMPPFQGDPRVAHEATAHLMRMHAELFAMVHALVPDALVATIEPYMHLVPAHPGDPDECARLAADDAWFNDAWLRGLATGILDVPGFEPLPIAGLRGAADAYGVNYYAAVRFGGDWNTSYSDRESSPVDAMGRAVFPAGLEAGLLRASRLLPDTPLLVTENGCPTVDETFRIRYLAAHLAAVGRVRAGGADVRGYFHWTAVDNWEWTHGFSDARFGLIGFDPETFARQVKRSGTWFADVIARGVLDPGSLPEG